jgi:hypothetical protein
MYAFISFDSSIIRVLSPKRDPKTHSYILYHGTVVRDNYKSVSFKGIDFLTFLPKSQAALGITELACFTVYNHVD